MIKKLVGFFLFVLLVVVFWLLVFCVCVCLCWVFLLCCVCVCCFCFVFSLEKEYVHVSMHMCLLSSSWEGAVEGILINADQWVCPLSLDKQILLGKSMSVEENPTLLIHCSSVKVFVSLQSVLVDIMCAGEEGFGGGFPQIKLWPGATVKTSK